jgi:hypothetical protein
VVFVCFVFVVGLFLSACFGENAGSTMGGNMENEKGGRISGFGHCVGDAAGAAFCRSGGGDI